jgi:hypothetical protein
MASPRKPTRRAACLSADLAYQLTHGVAQLRRMLDPKWAVDVHQQTRHPVQFIRLRAQQDAIRGFLQGAQIRRDPPAGFGERDFEQDLDRPAPRHTRQRLQHICGAIEVRRPGERFVE